MRDLTSDSRWDVESIRRISADVLKNDFFMKKKIKLKIFKNLLSKTLKSNPILANSPSNQKQIWRRRTNWSFLT
jgi:hypothetical protein